MESQSQTDFLMQVTHGESLMCHHKERHELNCESITQKPRCSLWDTRDFSWEMDWTFGFIILNLKVKQDEKGKILSFIHITSMQVFKINLNYANDSLFLTKKYICGSSDHVLRVWYGHSWKITKLSTLNASLRLHDLCPHIECFLLVNHLHKNCVLSYAVWKPPQKKATKTCSTMWTPKHKWTVYKSDMAQCTKTKYISGISHMASWRVQYSLSNLTFHFVTKKKKKKWYHKDKCANWSSIKLLASRI